MTVGGCGYRDPTTAPGLPVNPPPRRSVKRLGTIGLSTRLARRPAPRTAGAGGASTWQPPRTEGLPTLGCRRGELSGSTWNGGYQKGNVVDAMPDRPSTQSARCRGTDIGWRVGGC